MRKPHLRKGNNASEVNMQIAAQTLVGSMINDLYPLGKNIFPPQNMGEFAGVEALPEGEYPAMYCWIDTSRNNQLALSFNTPLLEELLFRLARQKGIPATPELVARAKALFVEVMTHAFKETIRVSAGETMDGTVQVHTYTIKGRQ